MNESSAPKRPKPWKWLIRLALGLGLIALLLSRRDTALQVKETFSQVSPAVILAAVACYWAGQLLSVWRWRLLLAARDIHLPFLTCVRLYSAGMFGSLFLPTSIGGDALRAALLTRVSPNAALPEAAASILIERVTGFVALLAVAAAGALFGGAAHQAGSALIGGTGLLVVFLVMVAVMRRLASSPPRDTGVQGKLRRIWGALDFYLVPGRQKALLAAVGISLVFQISQVFLNLGLAYAVGLNIPVGTIFWVHPLMQLAAMLPFGIGGLGVREAAAIQLLKSAGIVAGAGTALAWSLLWQATVWISSLPGAAAVKGK